MAEESLDPQEYKEVLFRLTLYAYRLFGCVRTKGIDSVLKGGEGGETPEDLAMTVLVRFLDPDDYTVAWKKKHGELTKKGLLGYLKKVIYNDFLDLKRKGKYRKCDYLPTTAASSEVENQRELSLDEFASSLEPPDLEAIRRIQREEIIRHFEPWPELVEIVKLQVHPDGYQAFTNKQLAELLETSVSDIENRKKRIASRLVKLVAAAEPPGGDPYV